MHEIRHLCLIVCIQGVKHYLEFWTSGKNQVID